MFSFCFFVGLTGCQQPLASNTTSPNYKASNNSTPTTTSSPNYGAYIIMGAQLIQQILPLFSNTASSQSMAQPTPQQIAGNSNNVNRLGTALNTLSNVIGGTNKSMAPSRSQAAPPNSQSSIINPQTIQMLIGIIGGMQGNGVSKQ